MYAMPNCLGMNWCSKHLIIINNPTQNDLFTEIENCIEVYNNSVIELIQCFGTSFFGRNWSPRKLGDQIPTKELGPKTLYSFNNL